jgi:membrane protease YdiL (CAAX protease family)
VTSGVFGIWHIRPTIAALRIIGVVPGSRGGWAGVAGAVAGTAASGGILSWFRHRSGSLAAPVLLHLTANCGAALAARAVAGARQVPAGR